MKKKQSSEITSRDNESNSDQKTNYEASSYSTESIVRGWKAEIALLNYEDSLNALDNLLEHLQNDSVPVEDLQSSYLRGNLYLDHCESLLSQVEQEVIELNPEKIKEDSEN